MNALVFILAMSISGPDFEIPRQNLYILVDTKSKNEYIVRRSKLVRELEIYDPLFFPAELYFLRSRYDIIVQEFEDNQTAKYTELPSFRYSKNEKWEPFAPGTFAADGMFTISLFTIVKWEQFEKNVFKSYIEKDYKNKVRFPPIYPPSFIEFYHKRETLKQMPNLSYQLIGGILPLEVERALENKNIGVNIDE